MDRRDRHTPDNSLLIPDSRRRLTLPDHLDHLRTRLTLDNHHPTPDNSHIPDSSNILDNNRPMYR